MDIQAALKEGYTQEEIMSELGRRTGMDYQSAMKEGYSSDEVLAELNKRDILKSSPTIEKPKETSITQLIKERYGGAIKGVVEALPYAGAMAGGLIASPGIATAPVGAGLGYLSGNYLKKGLLGLTGLEQQEPLSVRGMVAKDIPEAAIVGASGPIAEKGLGLLASGGGQAVKQILGKLQGIGAGAEAEAIKSGTKTGMSWNPFKSETAFDNALRGNITGEEIVENVRAALGTVRDKRSGDYRAILTNISGNKNQIDMRPIEDTLNKLSSEYGVKINTNPATGKTDIDLSRVAMGKSGRDDIKSIIETVKDWGTKQGDDTVIGLDTLKRQLDDFYSPSSQARQFVASLRNSVKDTIVKNVPEYGEMTKGYSGATNLLKEIESSLVSKKNGQIMADQTLRKLTIALKNDKEIAKDLMDILGEKGSQDISGQVAGYVMRSPVPLGLSGTGPALIGTTALTAFNPKFWPVLLASSPRVSAEFLRMYGKVASEFGGVAPTASQILTTAVMQEVNRKKR